MKPRFEDILHLVSYNGYAEDIRQAVAVNRDTWTDERIWQPFLMDQQFGPKKKGRMQILAENNENEINLLARLEDLQKFAEDTHLMNRFRKQVNICDTDGESALTAAIQKRCPNVVKFLVENGADINQTNKNGRSPLNLAKTIESRTPLNLAKTIEKENDGAKQHEVIKGCNGRDLQKGSEFIVSYLTDLGAVDIPEEVTNVIHRELPDLMEWMRMDRMGMDRMRMRMDLMRMERMEMDRIRMEIRMEMNHDRMYIDYLKNSIPPKPKRMKASLYKQQFGKRR